jgi:hypothetical protein
MLSDFSNENSEDYNILSAMGMKDRDIFQSPESTSLLMKQENETMGHFKVPISSSACGGQSPYFSVPNTPNKKPTISTMQDTQVAKPINNDTNEALPTTTNAVTQKEQSVQPTISFALNKEKNDYENKSRKLRPIGEFTVSSLDKEYQETMEFLKQEREQDQQLFMQCSKALRDKVKMY